MKIKIIACEVMKEELLSVHAANTVDYHFVPMGLHTRPQKLHEELSRLLGTVASDYDGVILGFGLCGGAARGLGAGKCILTIPRVHDCIPVFLGSRKEYERMQNTPGTFYLTCGWLECGNSIMADYHRVCEKYGEHKAKSVFGRMYDSYKRVVFLRTNHPRQKEGLDAAGDIAALLGLDCRVGTGSMDYLERLVNGPWNDEEFIRLKPGDILDDSCFEVNKDYLIR